MSTLSSLFSPRAFRQIRFLTTMLGAMVALSAFSFADSQARIVRLSDVQGSVQIDKNSGLGFENAFLNLPITQGVQIQTHANGRAEIEFEDGSTMHLAPNSKLVFSTLGVQDSGQRISVLELSEGTAYVNWIEKSGGELTLNFAHEKIDLTHPAHVRVDALSETARCAVFKGEVQVDAPGGPLTVEKKKMATFDLADNDKPTLAKNITQEPLDAWDKGADQYHDQYSRNNSTPYGYGFSDLDYYGAYSSVPGYGMMWQPYFTGVGWDPFGFGAWSWYPGYGYMYASGYPWGWLPFHYGNWAMVPGYGWMWQPGYWNSFAVIPRYSAVASAGFRPLVVPTGTTKTVIVGRAPAANSLGTPPTFISRNSAGLGIPRGVLGNLKSLNHEVAKTGSVQVQSMPQFGTISRGSMIGESRGGAEHGSFAPAAHASSAGSASHGSAGGSHH